MDELIIPGRPTPAPKRTELERNGQAALVHVVSTGDVEIVDRIERSIVVPVSGDWILVEAELWASMVRELMLGRTPSPQLPRAKAKLGRGN